MKILSEQQDNPIIIKKEVQTNFSLDFLMNLESSWK